MLVNIVINVNGKSKFLPILHTFNFGLYNDKFTIPLNEFNQTVQSVERGRIEYTVELRDMVLTKIKDLKQDPFDVTAKEMSNCKFYELAIQYSNDNPVAVDWDNILEFSFTENDQTYNLK